MLKINKFILVTLIFSVLVISACIQQSPRGTTNQIPVKGGTSSVETSPSEGQDPEEIWPIDYSNCVVVRSQFLITHGPQGADNTFGNIGCPNSGRPVYTSFTPSSVEGGFAGLCENYYVEHGSLYAGMAYNVHAECSQE